MGVDVPIGVATWVITPIPPPSLLEPWLVPEHGKKFLERSSRHNHHLLVRSVSALSRTRPRPVPRGGLNTGKPVPSVRDSSAELNGGFRHIGLATTVMLPCSSFQLGGGEIAGVDESSHGDSASSLCGVVVESNRICSYHTVLRPCQGKSGDLAPD